jgi:hypothetical protein
MIISRRGLKSNIVAVGVKFGSSSLIRNLGRCRVKKYKCIAVQYVRAAANRSVGQADMWEATFVNWIMEIRASSLINKVLPNA